MREEMGLDPLSGYLFVFRNRCDDRVKVLLWDDDRLAIFYKGLEKGVFKFPIVSAETRAAQVSVTGMNENETSFWS